MVLTSAVFVYNMLKNNIRQDAKNAINQTQIRILNELTEPETLMIPIVREVRNIFARGGTANNVSNYFNAISAELLKKEHGFAFEGLHGYFEALGGVYIPAPGWTVPANYNAKERPWYIAGIEAEGRITASPMFRSLRSGNYQINYSCQIFDTEGRSLGVIAMNVPLYNISDFVAEINIANGGYGFLVNENFELVAHYEQSLIGSRIIDISSAFRVMIEALQQVTNEFIEVDAKNYQNRDSIFFCREMENGWYLGLMMPKSEYYRNMAPLLISLGVLAFILMVTTNIILIRIDRAKNKVNRAFNEQGVILAENLKLILNSIDSMIYVTEPDTGKILFINDSMKNHYNVGNDCIGERCYKIFQNGLDDRCDFCPCFKLDKNPNEVVIWEEHSTKTNRIYRNIDRYISWPGGQTVHIQHSVDMTELISAKELAEQSSHYKSAFLANMSHEVRTPMNAILGIAEIYLRNEYISPSVEEAFAKIYDSGNLLLHIINDILDLSKIEAGKMELIPVKYNVPSLINDSIQLNLLRYESKPIECKINVDKDTPLTLYGDELRIKQVLNNVLSNAFKYTHSGEVILSVSAEYPKNEEKTAILVFNVKDTGQGMTEEQVNRLFDEYTRFNLKANRTTVGTGLGMTITKNILNMMNGTINVESRLGEGSVFTVKIPQLRLGSSVCGTELADKLHNFAFHSTSIEKKSRIIREYMPYGSVLIVDDVESNIYVAKGMLMSYGLKIDTATSGFEAIEKIEKGNVYDVIFMDHMMPKMDGMETVKRIREMNYKNTIVALTANAIVGQAGVFMENGFDGYISKPIDSREMNHLLNDFIRNKQPPEVVHKARLEQQQKNSRHKKQGIELSDVERFFVLDAEKAKEVLEKMFAQPHELSKPELELYIITIHGMKSALANIGEKQLSEIALRLETAGREENHPIILEETSVFIKALQSLIIKYKPEEKTDTQDTEITDESKQLLREKLADMKEACVSLNKKAAKEALNLLKQINWPQNITSVLDNLSVLLLHSAFEEVESIVEDLLEQY
ncbi:MAG: response regulator [Treponema sp.]|nr:response regulator [Treponema sp.]